jgi:hypothetical protein
LQWQLSIDVHKPKDVAVRSAATSVHLYCSTALGHDNLIAKALCEISRAIGASTICDNNLSSRRPLTQLVKKWPYQRGLVKDGNND